MNDLITNSLSPRLNLDNKYNRIPRQLDIEILSSLSSVILNDVLVIFKLTLNPSINKETTKTTLTREIKATILAF